MLRQGLQELLIKEAPTSAGVTVREFALESDSVLVVVWVSAISGSMDIEVSGIVSNNSSRQTSLITFPTITAPTDSLLQRRSGIMPARGKVTITYSGACDYEIFVRGVAAGSSDTRVLGSSTLRITKRLIGDAVSVLIPASLDERNAIAIKNWSTAGTIYVAETMAKAHPDFGWPIGPKDALGVDVQAGVALYAVSDGPDCDIRIAESGA